MRKVEKQYLKKEWQMTTTSPPGWSGSLRILTYIKFVLKIYSFKCVSKSHVQSPACEQTYIRPDEVMEVLTAKSISRSATAAAQE